jgi:hypothetical protein
VRQFLRNPAAEAGLKRPEQVAVVLQMLYDSVLVTAQAEGGAASAKRARRLAQMIVRD